jgi:hypothetical protein
MPSTIEGRGPHGAALAHVVDMGDLVNQRQQ